jgi:hypothetical protein
MGDLAGRLLVLTLSAFCLWTGLLWMLRRVDRPLAGILAAVLSWAVASAALAWVVTALQHTGLWPPV